MIEYSMGRIYRYSKMLKKDIGELEDKIKPNHYKSDNDVIKFCLDNGMGFAEGNILKYVRRWREKNGIEDLLKAKEYLNRLIENYKK